jgi:GNAT superfamily N-acetyltransferase
VPSAGLAAYIDAFRKRADVMAEAGATPIDEPGIYGYDAAQHGRLLVFDDRAAPFLAERLPDLTAGFVSVLDAAPECRALFDAADQFHLDEVAAAMVRPDLVGLPEPTFPEGLAVVRVTERSPRGLELDAAIAACLAYDQHESPGDPTPFIRRSLLALPHGCVLAAVDRDGRIRATSAAGHFDGDALVLFVTTDPELRGRGIATAMTAAALSAARAAGAVRACLDGSEMGEPIYRRLGFRTVARNSRFFHIG